MNTGISTARNKSLLFSQAFFVLLWSSGAIVIAIGLHYANPLTFLFWRFLFAIVFMLLIVVITKAPWPSDRATWWKTILAGFLTQFLYIGCYFFALYEGVSPTVTTIILGLQPILTAIVYNALLKHPIRFWQYLGLLLGLVGVCISVVYDFHVHQITTLGVIYAFLSVLFMTSGSIVQKHNPKMDLRTGSVIQYVVSIIPIMILNYFFGSFHFPVEPAFTFSLAWMVLVVSISATCLYYKLLRDGSAVAVNSLFYLVPVVTAVLCYFIFGTALNLYVGIGIVLILLGVLITQKNS